MSRSTVDLTRDVSRSSIVDVSNLTMVAIIALAVGIQVLTTLPVGADGLRVSLADLVVGAMLGIAAATRLRYRAPWPHWRLPHAPLWLAAMTAWLLFALILGYRESGQWIAWAWINKGAGWLMLLAYFAVGAWLATSASASLREAFFRWLLVFAWIAVFYGVLLHAAFRTGLLDALTIPRAEAGPWHAVFGVVYGGSRLSGFMANPNAFGFALAVFIVLHLAFLGRAYALSPWAHRLGAAICVAGLVGSGSRTAWVAAIVGVATLTALRALAWREVLRLAALAVVACGLLLVALPQLVASLRPGPPPTGGMQALQSVLTFDTGVRARIDLLQDAIRLWRTSPLVGTGLGASTAGPANGEVQYAHNTFLWLLTETGLVGLLLWAGFFALSLRVLARDGRGADDVFATAVAAALVVFLVMSLGMEAMYQRHLWLLLGIGLALSAARSGDKAA